MKKTRKISKRSSEDGFAKDEIVGEWEKPGPKMDPDAAWISAQLAQITGKAGGVALEWLPPWLKRAKLAAFDFYFFDHGLVVDSFNRDREEMDALAPDFTDEQRQEISHKTVLCNEHGIAYMAVGPDDELDSVQIAAKIGKTTFKKGPRPKRVAAGDGITEEGDDL